MVACDGSVVPSAARRAVFFVAAIEAEIAAHTSAHRLASTLDLSPLFAALALFSLVSAYVWNGLFVWRRDPVAPHRFPIKKVRSSS